MNTKLAYTLGRKLAEIYEGNVVTKTKKTLKSKALTPKNINPNPTSYQTDFSGWTNDTREQDHKMLGGGDNA